LHDTRRTRVVLATLLTVALALIATDYVGGSAPLRAIGGAVFGTAERAISAVTGPIAGFFERGAGATGATGAGRLQALERQLIRLRAKLSNEQLNRTDYDQLVKLLRFTGRSGYRIVAANVIAVGQRYEPAVTLDAGSRDGIRPEETVVSASGLVGTVTSVSPWTCTVMLATDASAVVGVRLAGSGQMGWVTGAANSLAGSDVLRLHVLGSSSAIAPGQQLVTSASFGDRPYVAGVRVGVVTRVETSTGLTGTALVRPFVDFSALDVVGVVVTPSRPGTGPGA
jgi:rod shape-determining protein MreC